MNKKLLITYLTAGDPSLRLTERLIDALDDAGVDIIELGIPFSDPLADGPVIQASHQRALKNRVTLKNVFELVSRVRRTSQIPIMFMLSVNLIYRFGVKNFIAAAKKVVLQGVVIPDSPPEEMQRDEFCAFAKSGLDVVYLVAPNTPEKRIAQIAKQSTGFVYLVSTAGVTGIRKKLSNSVKDVAAKIRQYSSLPVCVGFGISNPAQAKAAAAVSDGVIVGSALVNKIVEVGDNLNCDQGVYQVLEFVRALRRAVD